MDAAALIERKIRLIFPDRRPDEIAAILNQYGAEAHERERERVHLAILKICDQDTAAELGELVAAAKSDYRDILQRAEYPAASALPPQERGDRRAAAQAADRAHYQRWLQDDD